MATRNRLPASPVLLTPSQEIWVLASCLQEPLKLVDPEEPAEATAYRQDRERRALKGDVTALADLIKMDYRYLRTARFAETVRVLRSEAHFSRTKQQRDHAVSGLLCLQDALGAGDLRGRRPHPRPMDITRLYDLLLPVYQQAKRQQASPLSCELPCKLWDYFSGNGPVSEGITPFRECPPQGGKIVLNTPATFTIPQDDLERLKLCLKSTDLKNLVRERIAAIFNLGRGEPAEAVEWIAKLVKYGREELKESQHR